MAEYFESTPIDSPRSSTNIDLEDMSPQTRTVRDSRRPPFQQNRTQSLARQIAENVLDDNKNTKSRGNSNSDQILETISGHESLKKNYRKIARRTNLGVVEQIFMYKATNADELKFEKHDTWSACFERLRSTTETNEAMTALEICVITADNTNLDRAFSFIHKIFLISYDGRQQAYSAPSEMVIRILQSKWTLSDEIMTKITESTCAKELSLPVWQPKLPSHRTAPGPCTSPCLH